MNKISIVLFSGGVDSTGALYRLLTTTDNTIIAHHINYVNAENRYTVENVVCKSIVEYLSINVRQVTYTESTFIFPFVKHIGWDLITSMYIGGLVCKNYMTKDNEVELCLGDTADDFGAYKWKSPIAQSIALLSSLEDPRNEKQLIPTLRQPVVDMTKADIIKMLPDELFKLTWSCRRPVIRKDESSTTFSSCGVCPTCKDLQHIKKYVSKSVSFSNTKGEHSNA